MSSWGKWDQLCSNTCGNSLRTRQRTVLKQPLGFGRACPSLIDKQLCHEPACMSFTWRLGIWNTCQLTSQASVCGKGTQAREVVCSPDPAREWICAKQAPKPAVVQKCSLSCPGTVWTPPRISNPSNKVFNPTKILLHPSYFVWKASTQTPNPCCSSPSGVACTPPEICLPLLLNKWKSALVHRSCAPWPDTTRKVIARASGSRANFKATK